MEWLNYHHLYYFWAVAREGSMTRASQKLYVAQPTISEQIGQLEAAVGDKLFIRSGRSLTLSETGRLVYRYAEDIFTLGGELIEALHGRPVGRPLQFRVGVAEILPKLVVYQLLKPAAGLAGGVHLICRGGPISSLLSDLASHDLDLVLTDSPTGPQTSVRVFSHLLGECGVTIFGKGPRAVACRKKFPEYLHRAPFLMPSVLTTMRRSLESWFESKRIVPDVVAEFEDGALLKSFGQMGTGFFASASMAEQDICRQYGVTVVGRIEEIRERFYAISAERKLKHPAVLAITDEARQNYPPEAGRRRDGART